MGKDGRLVVLWADPGVSTGWSLHVVPCRQLVALGQVASMKATWWRTGVFRGRTSENVDAYLALAREVWEQKLEDDDVFVMGVEGFSLGMLSRDPDLLEPVRFNAVLEDRLRGTGVRVEVQMPGEKDVITETHLRLWGVYKPGPDHQRDAQRHGLLFMRKWSSQPKVRARTGWE